MKGTSQEFSVLINWKDIGFTESNNVLGSQELLILGPSQTRPAPKKGWSLCTDLWGLECGKHLEHSFVLKGLIRWQVACSIKKAGHHDSFYPLERQGRGTFWQWEGTWHLKTQCSTDEILLCGYCPIFSLTEGGTLNRVTEFKWGETTGGMSLP